jgi:hypothetical protein
LFVRTGPVRSITFGFVGTQIPAGVGIHGPGVSTPNAAAVSAAVVGFKRLLQTPNGTIFKNGTQSVHVAIGPVGPHSVFGRIFINVGTVPKGQLRRVPVQQQNPIYASFLEIKFPFSS